MLRLQKEGHLLMDLVQGQKRNQYFMYHHHYPTTIILRRRRRSQIVKQSNQKQRQLQIRKRKYPKRVKSVPTRVLLAMARSLRAQVVVVIK